MTVYGTTRKERSPPAWSVVDAFELGVLAQWLLDKVEGPGLHRCNRQRNCASPDARVIPCVQPLTAAKLTAEPWSLTSLLEKLIKISAKVVSHGRYVTFQMAEVAVPRQMFAEILSPIARLQAPPAPA